MLFTEWINIACGFHSSFVSLHTQMYGYRTSMRLRPSIFLLIFERDLCDTENFIIYFIFTPFFSHSHMRNTKHDNNFLFDFEHFSFIFITLAMVHQIEMKKKKNEENDEISKSLLLLCSWIVFDATFLLLPLVLIDSLADNFKWSSIGQFDWIAVACDRSIFSLAAVIKRYKISINMHSRYVPTQHRFQSFRFDRFTLEIG